MPIDPNRARVEPGLDASGVQINQSGAMVEPIENFADALQQRRDAERAIAAGYRRRGEIRLTDRLLIHKISMFHLKSVTIERDA
jgi:hypothetical protein